MISNLFEFIPGLYRRVAEETGVDMNTKHFASMKRDACMARARNLRLFVHSPHDNRNTSVRYAPHEHFNLMVVFFLSFRHEPITNLHFAATCWSESGLRVATPGWRGTPGNS